MKLKTAKRLHDAAGACRELQIICAGQTRESFLTNRLLNLSVWKLIEIVGEALRQAVLIDPSLNEKIPDLRDIIDTRHRITHGYDSVSFNLLWNIVQDEVPPLLATLDELLVDAPQIE